MSAMPTQQPYTHGHHDSVLRSHRWRTAQNSAAYLLPLLAPGTDLLDVGCGPGTLTADLAARVTPGRVVGVDLSADVVTQAREHARAKGVDNVSFVVGDFRTAGLPPASFDIVHAHQVLHHLTDPVGGLQTMAKLARPGGVVAAREVDYSAMVWGPADSCLDRWLAMVLQVVRRNGGEPNAGRHLLGWARQARLYVVGYTTSTWTFATPEERVWWADLWADRTVASAFAEQAVSYGIATPQELAEVAQGWRVWAEHDEGVFAVLHGEVLTRVV
jgi:ubiquinone/menaquinone biosynthesis C-methylase UbiE